jgi:hypothetical protein
LRKFYLNKVFLFFFLLFFPRVKLYANYHGAYMITRPSILFMCQFFLFCSGFYAKLLRTFTSNHKKIPLNLLFSGLGFTPFNIGLRFLVGSLYKYSLNHLDKRFMIFIHTYYFLTEHSFHTKTRTILFLEFNVFQHIYHSFCLKLLI